MHLLEKVRVERTMKILDVANYNTYVYMCMPLTLLISSFSNALSPWTLYVIKVAIFLKAINRGRHR